MSSIDDPEFLKRKIKELRLDLKCMTNLANKLRKAYKEDTGSDYLKLSATELTLLGGRSPMLRGRKMKI